MLGFSRVAGRGGDEALGTIFPAPDPPGRRAGDLARAVRPCYPFGVAATRDPARVLVVDDDEPKRDLLSRRLQQQGHTVDEAADGEQALSILTQRPYDLVLLDIVMPKLDGYGVLARMRADDRLRHVPVIVISSLGEVEAITRCLDMGADDYVTKPFNVALLRARVDGCLTKKRMRDHEQAYTRELVGFNETLTERLTALSDVSVAINSLHVDVVLEQILDLKQVMTAEASSLLVLDTEIGKLPFHVAAAKPAPP
ncbi:MAG: response regulator [Candidatus Rokubacteria bacterium]|nr:response regulator [Candidatus Rokubacteria bacterium]